MILFLISCIFPFASKDHLLNFKHYKWMWLYFSSLRQYHRPWNIFFIHLCVHRARAGPRANLLSHWIRTMYSKWKILARKTHKQTGIQEKKKFSKIKEVKWKQANPQPWAINVIKHSHSFYFNSIYLFLSLLIWSKYMYTHR